LERRGEAEGRAIRERTWKWARGGWGDGGGQDGQRHVELSLLLSRVRDWRVRRGQAQWQPKAAQNAADAQATATAADRFDGGLWVATSARPTAPAAVAQLGSASYRVPMSSSSSSSCGRTERCPARGRYVVPSGRPRATRATGALFQRPCALRLATERGQTRPAGRGWTAQGSSGGESRVQSCDAPSPLFPRWPHLLVVRSIAIPKSQNLSNPKPTHAATAPAATSTASATHRRAAQHSPEPAESRPAAPPHPNDGLSGCME